MAATATRKPRKDAHTRLLERVWKASATELQRRLDEKKDYLGPEAVKQLLAARDAIDNRIVFDHLRELTCFKLREVESEGS